MDRRYMESLFSDMGMGSMVMESKIMTEITARLARYRRRTRIVNYALSAVAVGIALLGILQAMGVIRL